MVGSEEFAAQIFDALARRRGITAMVLTKDQVREFWEQLSDPGFDAKLQTFFDMYVMTGLPCATSGQVKCILIRLSETFKSVDV